MVGHSKRGKQRDSTERRQLYDTMKPEQQRIAIAEACGWRQSRSPMWDRWWHEKGKKTYRQFAPDYLNDLNAMHEAEKVLDIVVERGEYREYLSFITGGEAEMIYATASQRAEAFLRTLDKWEETL